MMLDRSDDFGGLGLGLEDLLICDNGVVRSNFDKRLVSLFFGLFVTSGSLELIFSDDDRVVIGDGVGGVDFKIIPPTSWGCLKILLSPELESLESYVRGDWSCVDCELVDFIKFLGDQRGSFFQRWRKHWERIPSLRFFIKQYLLRVHSTRRTQIHYDVTAEFYRMLLHPEMIYSCAFFDSGVEDLACAQDLKLLRIAERCGLADSGEGRVLDIGCGWGTAAIRLAGKYGGASFDGISIASNQIAYANDVLVSDYGDLSGRVNFELSDYCEYRLGESGIYDYIFSIGMLEHVGKSGYVDFFKHVRRLLRVGGRAVIHSIVRREEGITHAWIDKYVFAGGYIPLISEVCSGVERNDMRIVGCYTHGGEHYYKTLQCWKENLFRDYVGMMGTLYRSQGRRPSISEYRRDFRRWYVYLSGSQSFFLPTLEDGAVCHFVIEKVS